MLTKNTSRAVIIINPASGKKDINSLKVIKKEALRLGWKGKIIETTIEKGSGKIAREEIKKGIKHIIVCGGDGTVREVLGDVAKYKITLGIIPLGTGNIFAKNLKIPLDIKEAMQVALSGKIKKVDLGKANENYFVLIAGMGLDVKAMREAKPETKSKFGILAYIYAGAKNINKSRRKYKVLINKNKKLIVKAKSIMVANIGNTEGNLKVVPGASPSSGDLKVGILKAKSIYSWFVILISLLLGRVEKSRDYDLVEAHTVEIYPLMGKESYECDGNTFPPVDKLTIKIFPASLSILTKEV